MTTDTFCLVESRTAGTIMSFDKALFSTVKPCEFFSGRIAEENSVAEFLQWENRSWRTGEPGKFLSEFVVIDDHHWIAVFRFPAGESFYTVIEGREIWGDYQSLLDALYKWSSDDFQSS